MSKNENEYTNERMRHAENEQKRKERMRNTLTQNKLAFAQQKNRELTKRCIVLEQELQKNQASTFSPDSEKVIQASLKIDSISPICYKILEEDLNFPPKSKIDKMLNEIKDKIPNLLKSIGNVTNIADIWKEKSGISKSETIHCCLSVDAIYFTPNVEIYQDSIFSGLIFKKDDEFLISKNTFKNFRKNPNDFQVFLNLNSDMIIRAAFVFQVQPFNIKYSSFVVHVEPAINGKANQTIVDMLFCIRDELKKRNITILSFAFDGDSAYSNLHNEFFKFYINSILKNNLISFSRSIKFKVSSDFLHLIKRLRYRLFGVEIHSGFSISNQSFNIEK